MLAGEGRWRRREGVEPSGDLTAPRLVLKTSGATGHLPSPCEAPHYDAIRPGGRTPGASSRRCRRSIGCSFTRPPSALLTRYRRDVCRAPLPRHARRDRGAPSRRAAHDADGRSRRARHAARARIIADSRPGWRASSTPPAPFCTPISDGRRCRARSSRRSRTAAMHPLNLEYDLARGERGRREEVVVDAARRADRRRGGDRRQQQRRPRSLLCLNTLATGREVLVSRGELIEIGGSFRLPDIMARSGADPARSRHDQPHASGRLRERDHRRTPRCC